MLGDDEHPISFILEPRVEGGHVKVIVRAGIRGMRALAGELTFRPEEWIAFREAIGQSRVTADEDPMRYAYTEDRANKENPTPWDCAVLALIDGRCRLVHLDVTPIEAETLPLLPTESMALTIALSQIRRGEAIGENTTAMCVLALARLTGRHDWTAE